MPSIRWSVLCLMWLACACSAQPQAVGPAEVARQRPWTDVSPDFTRGGAYDLHSPVTLRVRVEGLLLPEEGDAELLFSVTGAAGGALHLERGTIYHATLQRADEARRLGVSGRELPAGHAVVLRGWPASPAARALPVMLVRDIEWPGRAERLQLHDEATLQRFLRQSAARGESS